MNAFGLSPTQHNAIAQRLQDKYGASGPHIYADLFKLHEGAKTWFSKKANVALFLKALSSQMLLEIPMYDAITQIGQTLQSADPQGAEEMRNLYQEAETWNGLMENWNDGLTHRLAQFSPRLAQRFYIIQNMGSFTEAIRTISNELNTWDASQFSLSL